MKCGGGDDKNGGAGAFQTIVREVGVLDDAFQGNDYTDALVVIVNEDYDLATAQGIQLYQTPIDYRAFAVTPF